MTPKPEQLGRRTPESERGDLAAMLEEERALNRELQALEYYFAKISRSIHSRHVDERIRSNLPQFRDALKAMRDRGVKIFNRRSEIYLQVTEVQIRNEAASADNT